MPRAGDIVVSTPPKSGTTWTQGILAMLIAGDPDVDVQTSMKSPWIDIKLRDLGAVPSRGDDAVKAAMQARGLEPMQYDKWEGTVLQSWQPGM